MPHKNNISNKNIVCISGDIDGDSLEEKTLEGYFSILRKYGIKGTFPTTLDLVENYPERIKSILKEGHEIAGHGDIHDKFCGSLQEQTERLTTMINGFYDVLGLELKGFRSPYCKYNKNTFIALNNAGLKYDSSVKRFEIMFRMPYINKKYMDVGGYGFIKPFLKFTAQMYNTLKGIKSRPYNIYSNLLEIPVLGDSDYYLISSPTGPRYQKKDVEKIGSVWLENLKCFGDHGGILVINAHPNHFSPDYVGAMDYFIKNALKNNVTFMTLESITNEYKRELI